jgi:hypothetical protein
MLRLLDNILLTVTRGGSWWRGRIAYRALATIVVERSLRQR